MFRSWGGIMVGFGVIPLMDLIISEDTTNPTKEQSRHLSTQLRFKVRMYGTNEQTTTTTPTPTPTATAHQTKCILTCSQTALIT